jgi:hypothetical protein
MDLNIGYPGFAFKFLFFTNALFSYLLPLSFRYSILGRFGSIKKTICFEWNYQEDYISLEIIYKANVKIKIFISITLSNTGCYYCRRTIWIFFS